MGIGVDRDVGKVRGIWSLPFDFAETGTPPLM